MTVTAHFDGRVFVPDGPVDLPVGTRARIVVEPADAAPEVRPLVALAEALAQLPDDSDWPADGAAQIDHYLYGTPKRP